MKSSYNPTLEPRVNVLSQYHANLTRESNARRGKPSARAARRHPRDLDTGRALSAREGGHRAIKPNGQTRTSPRVLRHDHPLSLAHPWRHKTFERALDRDPALRQIVDQERKREARNARRRQAYAKARQES